MQRDGKSFALLLYTGQRAGDIVKMRRSDLSGGRPIKRATLTLFMRKAVELAGMPRRCVPHGLRKAIMRRLAETGSSAKEIAAISGHRTLKEIERYTAAADQAKLSKAAMAKLKANKRRT
jgi:integrase